MQPELNSQLKETDKAYLAGLFDGEGCANAFFRSKKHTSKKEEKEVIYFWPAVQLVISGTYAHLQLIQDLVGLGGVYRQKTGVCDFRITQPKEVLKMINAILLPYVRLKKKELLLLREAAVFIARHKRRSRWTKEELNEFHKGFVLPLKKGKDLGRPTKYEKDFLRAHRNKGGVSR